jgi:hypothetical protein
LLFFAVLFYYNVKSNNRLSNYEFSGCVEAIKYDVKGYPYYTIAKKEYYLPFVWNFHHQINIGDSMTKRRNEFIIRVVYKKTGKVQIFK